MSEYDRHRIRTVGSFKFADLVTISGTPFRPNIIGVGTVICRGYNHAITIYIHISPRSAIPGQINFLLPLYLVANGIQRDG